MSAEGIKDFQTSFVERPLPLPRGLCEIADMAIGRLAAKGFEARRGLTTEIAVQVSQLAMQRTIGNYCPKDRTAQRHATIESTSSWLQKGIPGGRVGRDFFGLYHVAEPTNDPVLAGYGWTGPQECLAIQRLIEQAPAHANGPLNWQMLAAANITWAIRISEEFQGNGLAAPFGSLITAGTRAYNDNVQTIWLDTWGSNSRSVSTYERIGFMPIPELDQPSIRITSTGESFDDIRLVMINPDHFAQGPSRA